ncbi:hypothetical protein CIL03_08500 [Virgibacillus indicus]|uniref:Zinc finger CHC2-type domain-containing protein n=1 Tax=Virgibacillus indicus TaxID=2024554 RepID=A0A265NB40_9BACI|nr:hypothetical protein [Virgibacillus indicus]OZU89047.1 hypothetical protein CIL03_08500 [Virgibacillus indicus]
MLPNILDVALAYDLQFNPKTYGKKESLAKCPFCKEDSNKRKKFYLSLNIDYQLYKCWYCAESGGVLDFEAKLSGRSFTEVKQKYFGKCQTPIHPAFGLDPYQLEKIGWKEYKRKSFKEFQEKKDEVFQDWENYVKKELVRNYALFMCIAHLENQLERRKELLIWFIKRCWDSTVPNMYEMIQDEFLKPEYARKEWAIEGMEIGRAAWKACIKTMDFEIENLLVYVIFADYFYRENKKAHPNKERATQNHLA